MTSLTLKVSAVGVTVLAMVMRGFVASGIYRYSFKVVTNMSICLKSYITHGFVLGRR